MRIITLLLFMLIPCMFSPTIYFQTLYGQNQNSSVDSTISPNLTDPAVTSSSHKLKVISSFYPIHEFVKKVGADKIDSVLNARQDMVQRDYGISVKLLKTDGSRLWIIGLIGLLVFAYVLIIDIDRISPFTNCIFRS